jgi:hypothetical protein
MDSPKARIRRQLQNELRNGRKANIKGRTSSVLGTDGRTLVHRATIRWISSSVSKFTDSASFLRRMAIVEP